MANTEAPRKEITIQGIEVEVLAPYVEGHTCTEAEAKALNQVRAENIRNNTAKFVKEALKNAGEGATVEKLSDEELQAIHDKIDQYDTEYEFTLASVGGGRAKRTPVEAEAIALARQALHAAIQSKGQKVKEYKESNEAKYAELLEEIAGRDKIIEKAKANVAEREAAAKEGLAGIEI